MSHHLVTSAIDSTGIAWLDATRAWLTRFPLSIIQLAGRIGVGATFFTVAKPSDSRMRM